MDELPRKQKKKFFLFFCKLNDEELTSSLGNSVRIS